MEPKTTTKFHAKVAFEDQLHQLRRFGGLQVYIQPDANITMRIVRKAARAETRRAWDLATMLMPPTPSWCRLRSVRNEICTNGNRPLP